VNDLRAAYWEELAHREPYFRVLTHEGSVETGGDREPTEAFFETGEADVAALLDAIASLAGHPVGLTSALDYGCGAGRLTLPLARRSGSVVACDIAPTMLVHARRNAETAGLDNVTFLESAELARVPDGSFDFICSLLVLQYIPATAGYEILRALLRTLAPGGIAALHLMFRRPRATRRPLATMARLRKTRRVPFTEINEYDLQTVLDEIAAADARCIGQFAAGQGSASGAVLIIERNR
jgi:SAM-dependent methyltransferase